jgi:hypothetical protein
MDLRAIDQAPLISRDYARIRVRKKGVREKPPKHFRKIETKIEAITLTAASSFALSAR